jgi:hypothetical protein
MVRFTVQMHADLAFLKRELLVNDAPTPISPPLESFAQAFASTVTQVAEMARGRTGAPDISTLREACAQAAQALRDASQPGEGARLMLRRLVEDLAALIRSIERAGVEGAQFRPRS